MKILEPVWKDREVALTARGDEWEKIARLLVPKGRVREKKSAVGFEFVQKIGEDLSTHSEIRFTERE